MIDCRDIFSKEHFIEFKLDDGISMRKVFVERVL